MEPRNFGYGHERHMSGRAGGNYSSEASQSPETSKRSMQWPFSGSVSTNANSPLDASEPETPVFPTHSSILRRYASNRSAARFHRQTPSSVSRTGAGHGGMGQRGGLGHGAKASISTIMTMASTSTLFPVPDYVANYIRGETPESLARRREEKARMAKERFPDIREGSLDIDEGVAGNILGANNYAHTQYNQEKTARCCMLSGWRATMSLTLLLVLLMVVASTVAIAVTAIMQKENFWTTTLRIFTKSSCEAVRGLDQGAHGAAAALGVLLVAGAGHAAQVLAAPSRHDVDEAHQDGGRLDVGRGLSIRNLKAVNIGRVLVSLLTILTATGTLVVLNALFFTTSVAATSSADLEDSKLEECSLSLNGPLLGAVLVFLVLTAGSLIIALALPNFKPLLTIGDGIASFANRPDPSVRQSTGSIVEDITGRATPSGQALVGNQEMRLTRWVNTISIGRWIFWTITWITPFALAMVALILSITKTKDTPGLSFSQPHWTLEAAAGSSRTSLAILASLPQIMAAVLYLSTSALLTAFFSARELGGYDCAAKAAAEEGGVVRLRVSSASEGMQTTSMYSTLPPFVSVLLWALFSAVGFLVSQSLSLVAVDGPDGEEKTGLGLNPLALIILAALLLALGLIIIAMSLLCQSYIPHNNEGTRTISSLCRSWGATSNVHLQMREQPSRQDSEHSTEPWQGDRAVSWAVSEAPPGTISSGQWMAAGR